MSHVYYLTSFEKKASWDSTGLNSVSPTYRNVFTIYEKCYSVFSSPSHLFENAQNKNKKLRMSFLYLHISLSLLYTFALYLIGNQVLQQRRLRSESECKTITYRTSVIVSLVGSCSHFFNANARPRISSYRFFLLRIPNQNVKRINNSCMNGEKGLSPGESSSGLKNPEKGYFMDSTEQYVCMSVCMYLRLYVCTRYRFLLGKK